jgi:hypothetical protein
VTPLFEFKDPEKKAEDVLEFALFFVKEDKVFLLHAVGLTIESDLDAGLDREGEAGPWSEIPEEDGLWIWEGVPGWASGYSYEHGDEGGEPIYDKRGKARRPSEAECKVILNGPLKDLFGPERWPPPMGEVKTC